MMGWDKQFLSCSLVAAALFFSGCSRPNADRPDAGRLAVFAGIPPVAYLADQIGGQHVAAEVLVQPGQDPHTFNPTPQQVARLSKAKLFFKIGMTFEDVLLDKLQDGAPRMKIVDVAAGVKKREMKHGCCDHDHEDHHEHGGASDPHVWLSPPLLKTQAENVAAALIEADPANAEEYRKNLQSLLGRIESAHRRIERKLAPYRGRSFFVYHPGFGYFADAYGLREEAIEAGGQRPAPRQLKSLVEKAESEGAKTIFVQPQFDPNSAKAIANAVGGRVAPIDGLKYDVLRNLEDIATGIENSFASLSPASTPGLN